jgi:predicted DNA-binding protein with PD1-like motif
MRHTLLEIEDGRRKFVLVLDAGEEALAAISAFAVAQNLTGATISGLGAFSHCCLGHFDPATKDFSRNAVAVQSEVLSLIGNIAGSGAGDDDGGDDDGGAAGAGPHLHVHCVVGLNDATTRGGHLIKGFVRPTMELVIEESPVHLQRGLDRASGLVLLQPNQKRD